MYDDMVKNECAPNRVTFHTLVPCLVEAGQLDRAIKCCHDVFSRKCRVHYSVLQVVMTALVAASRVEEATRIFEFGRKNCYPRDCLIIPSTKEGNDVKAETELDESVLSEEGYGGEKEPGNA
uniref:Pentatricopeptide repeat-containing protein n=1 Tax=Arundo donax TaxID=35708 RepID=A0A0A9GA62_ARUDO